MLPTKKSKNSIPPTSFSRMKVRNRAFFHP